MRVLFVTCGLPFPANSGTRIRVFHLIREVSKRAEVHVFSLLTEDLPADIDDLRACCKSLEVFAPPAGAWELLGLLPAWFRHGRPLATLPFYSRAMAARIREWVETERIDVVQIEHSFLACYRDAVPAGGGCGTVLSFVDVGSLQYRRIARLPAGVMRRAGFLLKAALMQGWEARVASRFDRSVLVSRDDERHLKRSAPALQTSIVANGVDCERFRPLAESKTAANLLFVGVLDYPPNSDAVSWFVAEILPEIERLRPEVRLCIAGLSPPLSVMALERNNIVVRGFVEELEPIYRESTLAVVPLRAGGGTRLKILEAMALGRPVVSTTIGCEGLEAVAGEHLLVADSAKEFAAAVVRALSDSDLRGRLAANGRSLVEEHYCWTALGAKLLTILEAVCKERVSSSE
jgi:sugar transferase (PEP-CTERM/EpsH1 system associated)